ncbi:thiamine phosphate synthase [Taibaiella sp. KBW10]|uniref:thiamine phosphate synthase n=1 Tax=Taibaiella sp. KBW10 TaxID=2153357 RepID=UPI00131550CC|nr:thiamine phosphate synthase [Taibaiella sp. KBW10]
MIIITHPETIDEEAFWINALLDHGLERLHIRKPGYTAAAIDGLIRQIDARYYDRLVLHQQHQLAGAFGMSRTHYTEEQRNDTTFMDADQALILSTSVHTIEAFNGLNKRFSYAFMSPVYESISKPGYRPATDLWTQIKQRTNTAVALVALGGISPANIAATLNGGFDEVALMGSIWKQKQSPLAVYQQCRNQQTNLQDNKHV